MKMTQNRSKPWGQCNDTVYRHTIFLKSAQHLKSCATDLATISCYPILSDRHKTKFIFSKIMTCTKQRLIVISKEEERQALTSPHQVVRMITSGYVLKSFIIFSQGLERMSYFIVRTLTTTKCGSSHKPPLTIIYQRIINHKS